MKRVGAVLLMLCLIFGSFSSVFAADGSTETVLSEPDQEQLFELPFGEGYTDDDCYTYYFKDLEYHYEDGEDLLYVIGCPNHVSTGGQVVFDLDGEIVDDPEYPELVGTFRKYIEFDNGNAYSVQKDADAECPYRLSIHDLNENDEDGYLGSLQDSIEGYSSNGIRVNGNQIAYHSNKEYTEEPGSPNFYIGTLAPFTASGASTAFIYSETGRIGGFDFNPSGTALIYGTFVCSDASVDYGIAVRTVDSETGEEIDEFIIDDTDYESDRGMNNAVRSLYTTDDYIVVMTRIEELEIGRIQRFTFDGELIDEVETNFHIACMTEGPDGSTIYIQKSDSDMDSCDGNFEVVQVTWPESEESSEPTGRPKAVISERSFGGKTVATFKNDGFGLLKVEDPETGAVDFKAPLKSDKEDVRLRIPFEDVLAKVASGANNLLIPYKGQVIRIPMSAFDCADLLGGMPCQDDATVEIQLTMDEAGNVKVVVQLFVVEQVDAMIKVVHRKTIQY